MPYALMPGSLKKKRDTINHLMIPVRKNIIDISPLISRCNRPLKMTFEDQVNILVYFHLEEHQSGRHLLQVLKDENFAKRHIAPEGGIRKSSFFEDISSRGLEQMAELFQKIYGNASSLLPKEYAELGDLTLIDGSLIDAVLSMYWADYRDGSRKAKVHVGFDLNHGIPKKIFLTDGKGDERPFVSRILSPGETGVMDRYYQRHKSFDEWQAEGKHFICRIKASTRKKIIRNNPVLSDSHVFYDAVALLGTPRINLTEQEVRVIGYKVEGIVYWVATDRHDLTAEQVALAYRLRWNIEVFFGWWKRHLKVYHLISRSKYGLMVQILAGLITYLLLAIYCHNQYHEKVSVLRLREISIAIRNEGGIEDILADNDEWIYSPFHPLPTYASS
jgi:hypothetical protein